MINITKLQEHEAAPIPDLIAPEGKVYRHKLFGVIIGKEVYFTTLGYAFGKKLDVPIVETEIDFELLDEETIATSTNGDI